jgi:modulator of FtsH protease HflC
MQAYDRSLARSDTRLVLRPDSNFFRYFGDPSGKSAADGAAVLPAPAPARSSGAAGANK